MPSNETIESGCFQLSYSHGLDEKRRVQVPAKWRPLVMATPLTLVVWPQGTVGPCLLAMTPKVWTDLVNKVNSMPFADPRAETLRRILGRDSETIKLDGAGRISLPDTLAKKAGIEKQALFLGLLDRFQIWSPERYEKVAPLDEQMAPQAFSML